jgi:aminoglycoside phosphotransferase (APT) family kinase protein
VSAEHSEINATLVSQLIASQFPQWADLSIKPVSLSGWDNRTFHLGFDMSVRLPSAEGYVAQVEKEHRWLPRLAPLLPLPIPVPLAKGIPDHGYPWPWSVYRWLEGENATLERIADLSQFAISLAEFLLALQRINSVDGPPAGAHNFFRGGPLTTYDAETRVTIEELVEEVDTVAATKVWQAALESSWQGAPVWVHGDVASGNLLVKNGRLSAVIDFGCCGVGDPACDLVMAWTFFSGESREAFRAALGLDQATWARARGWALWKALITLAEHIEGNPDKSAEARRVITEVLAVQTST